MNITQCKCCNSELRIIKNMAQNIFSYDEIYASCIDSKKHNYYYNIINNELISEMFKTYDLDGFNYSYIAEVDFKDKYSLIKIPCEPIIKLKSAIHLEYMTPEYLQQKYKLLQTFS